MNPYEAIIPRLNGDDIERRFDYYLKLVKKGIAGFIVFGGDMETVKEGIMRLQDASPIPLIIASDLERGLGQQLKGGAVLPPQMALSNLIKQKSGLKLLKTAWNAVSIEAKYAGINTILAPVLDINTNPLNPIISTRAFGEEPEIVSKMGSLMIKTLQGKGINACGKHFPGHGDTKIDSHIGLPMIKKGLKDLKKCELLPFKKAIENNIRMLMLGHLSVPSLDPSGLPASLSEKAVKYLKHNLNYKGITITDAMNMGGLSGYTEEEASVMALRAGIDIILHPSDTDGIASYLKGFPIKPNKRLLNFRKRQCLPFPPLKISFNENKKLSYEITKRSILINGRLKPLKRPALVILNDDEGQRGEILRKYLLKGSPPAHPVNFRGGFAPPAPEKENKYFSYIEKKLEGEFSIIVAVFSDVRAWKGGTGEWIKGAIKMLKDRASVLVSFGSPYLLGSVPNDKLKIYAYSGSDDAQKAVSEIIVKYFS
jgi:beta-glucosidase-like glycosyl hydrolase